MKYIRGMEEFTLQDLKLEDLTPADIYQIHEDSSYTSVDKLKTTIYNYREGYAVLSTLNSTEED